MAAQAPTMAAELATAAREAAEMAAKALVRGTRDGRNSRINEDSSSIVGVSRGGAS